MRTYVVFSCARLPHADAVLYLVAHGHPTLLWPKDLPNGRADMFGSISGPGGLLSQFLEDLGPILMEK